MLKKLLVILLALTTLISTLTGCAGSIEGKIDKDIVIALDAEFTGMDPHDTNHGASFSVQKSMLEGLFAFDKDMKVVPMLAESYECNKEATEFIFHLRKGVMFHDGTPFNAEAVKVNIDRLANQENRLKRNSLFAMVDKTEVVDEHTVKIILKNPFGAMINTLAHPAAAMHSPAALNKYGKEVTSNPVGTGPFKFKEWVPGDHVTVVKNEQYWMPGYPKVDSITFKPVTENSTRVAMLQTGEADFVYPLPSEQVDIIKRSKELEVEVTPTIGVRHITINCMKKPFDDIRVRKAMNYAIDKNTFSKVAYNGYAEVSDSVLAPNTQFYSRQTPYEYNLGKAKELLKEAGYEQGFEAEIWASNNSQNIRGMEFIQQQLEKVNIHLKIYPLEPGLKNQIMWGIQRPEDAKVQLHYTDWPPSTGDADWGLRPLFATESFPPKAFNTAYYSNPEVDDLLEAGIKTADPELRRAAYKKAQEVIWNDAPWIFLIVNENIVGKRSELKGVHALPDGILSSMQDMEIE